MKTYTFTLPKKENSAKIYKDALMERIITAYPWLTIDSSFDYPKSNFGIEYAGAGDTITLGLSKKHNVSWLPKTCSNCPLASKCYKIDNYNLETEFFKALDALDAYAKKNYPFDLDYDFKDIYGTPIKIFHNFVQIGYDIIPIAPGSLNYLKPETKKTIINLTIKVKNNGWF